MNRKPPTPIRPRHATLRTTSWISLREPSRVSDLTRAYVCRISMALGFGFSLMDGMVVRA